MRKMAAIAACVRARSICSLPFLLILNRSVCSFDLTHAQAAIAADERNGHLVSDASSRWAWRLEFRIPQRHYAGNVR